MNSNPRNLILLRDAINFANEYFQVDTRMSKVFSLEALLQEIRDERDTEPENEHIHMIDVDWLIDKMIALRYEYYEKIFKQTFQLVEIYGSNCINFDQFYLLVRSFHPNISDVEAFKMFHSQYDLIDEDEKQKYLSFRTFGILAEKNKLFGEEDIKTLQSYSADSIFNFEHLAQEWTLKLKLIKLKLIKANKYSAFYIKILRKIEEDLHPPKNDPFLRLKWLRYKMVDKDANVSIVNYELEKLLPERLLQFQKGSRFALFSDLD